MINNYSQLFQQHPIFLQIFIMFAAVCEIDYDEEFEEVLDLQIAGECQRSVYDSCYSVHSKQIMSIRCTDNPYPTFMLKAPN